MYAPTVTRAWDPSAPGRGALLGHGRAFPPGGLASRPVYLAFGTRAVGFYGLMVMVSVALTVLSCESCSCMGKLKVPA